VFALVTLYTSAHAPPPCKARVKNGRKQQRMRVLRHSITTFKTLFTVNFPHTYMHFEVQLLTSVYLRLIASIESIVNRAEGDRMF
jgi:hypothetical protein